VDVALQLGMIERGADGRYQEPAAGATTYQEAVEAARAEAAAADVSEALPGEGVERTLGSLCEAVPGQLQMRALTDVVSGKPVDASIVYEPLRRSA
jgi:hypothetical protein